MNKENSLRFFFTQHIFVRSQHQLETKQTVNLDTAAQWKYSILFITFNFLAISSMKANGRNDCWNLTQSKSNLSDDRQVLISLKS